MNRYQLWNIFSYKVLCCKDIKHHRQWVYGLFHLMPLITFLLFGCNWVFICLGCLHAKIRSLSLIWNVVC